MAELFLFSLSVIEDFCLFDNLLNGLLSCFFKRDMAWFVLHDPPNHDASALHCGSLVYVGAQPVFLFLALYSPAYVYKVGEFFGHESRSRKH